LIRTADGPPTPAGILIRAFEPRRHDAQYQYDHLNRRTLIQYGVVGGNPTSTVTLTYDLGDRLCQAVDSKSGTISRQFGQTCSATGQNTTLASGLDFLTQEVTPQGSVTYTPDAAGRRTSMSVTVYGSAQPAVSYTYDNADKLLTVSQNSLTTTKNYTGDAAGRLHTVTLPNGVVVTYGYDRDSHVTSLTYGALGNLTYGYDADGRRTTVGGSLAKTNIPAAISSITYNADNSPSLIAGSAGVTNDNDGDITCIGGNTCPEFSYDERGHLQQWAANPYTKDYYYDAFGRRYETASVGSQICYVYDGLNPVATTLCGSTQGLIDYLLGVGLDELYLTSNSGINESFLRDALNSTLAVTSASGAILDQVTYDPYGNNSDSNGSYAPGFKFTGREYEGAGFAYTTLYNLRGRYYDAALGRFISRDPAGLAGGINFYAYAGDDPVDFSDPTGEWVFLPPPGCDGCRALSGPDTISIPRPSAGGFVYQGTPGSGQPKRTRSGCS
jgi:RHS repeat-associated protein